MLEPATRRELKQVMASLERIEEGDYGTCVECGNEIQKGRLEAIPHALRCIACASQSEI